MGSTVIDLANVLIAHINAFWGWATTGSAGAPPL
ncbi:hypothetical protein DFR76_10288 [Nocardia pseudobrasiliensis]|uniref:Uncharacterized protein n=1 Tax=Nocardia pseudobrasiliensis TaxID=45979 RepID=A0A370IC76_9NOCA|nr:hypothetical protein DFR76_10288 [Nocardia pseudobrasiliensis]